MRCSQRQHSLLIIGNLLATELQTLKSSFVINPRIPKCLNQSRIIQVGRVSGCGSESSSTFSGTTCIWVCSCGKVAAFPAGPVFQGEERMHGWAPQDALCVPSWSPSHWGPGWDRGSHLSSIWCPWLSWRQSGLFLATRYVQLPHLYVPTLYTDLGLGLFVAFICVTVHVAPRKAGRSVPRVLKAPSGFIAVSGLPECVSPPGFPFCPVVRFLRPPSKGKTFFLFFTEAHWTRWGCLCFLGESLLL